MRTIKTSDNLKIMPESPLQRLERLVSQLHDNIEAIADLIKFETAKGPKQIAGTVARSKNFALKLTPATHKRIKKLAASTGLSMNDIINQFIETGLAPTRKTKKTPVIGKIPTPAELDAQSNELKTSTIETLRELAKNAGIPTNKYVPQILNKYAETNRPTSPK